MDSDASNHLDLLVTDVLGVQTRGFLHGEQRHDLQQVVLHDVANDAVVVKVPAAALGAKVLGEANLHVADVRPGPEGLEHDVAEAEDGDVLDELLAEVVVDAVGVLLGENLREARGELPGRFQIPPERLLDDHPRLTRGGAALPRRVLRDGHEDGGRDGEVKDPHGLLPHLGLLRAIAWSSALKSFGSS